MLLRKSKLSSSLLVGFAMLCLTAQIIQCSNCQPGFAGKHCDSMRILNFILFLRKFYDNTNPWNFGNFRRHSKYLNIPNKNF